MALDAEHAESSVSAEQNDLERYRAMIEQAGDAIFVSDTQGVYLEINDSAARLLGRSREEIVGRHILDFVDEPSRPEVAQDIASLEAGPGIFRERRLTRGDGSVVIVEVRATRLSDGRLEAIVRDVTERKRAEEALRQSQQRLSVIFENTIDALALYQVSGPGRYRVVKINPAFLALACRRANRPVTRAMVMGISYEQLVDDVLRLDATARALSSRYLEAAIATGKTQRWEEATQRASGPIYSERIDAPIFGENGHCEFVLRVVRDVTEKKRAEEALRDSEQRFRSYFQLPLVGIAISSLDQRWVEVNDRLCSILGYTREELLTVSWRALTHPDDVSENQALFERALSGEIDGYSLEKRFIRKDGQVIHASLSARPVRRADGAVAYFVTLVQDVTEKKVAEMERERALASERRAREEFARQLIASQEAERSRIASELHDSLGQALLLIKNRAQIALADKSSTPAARQQFEAIAELAAQSVAEVRQISHDLRPYQIDQLGLTRAIAAMVEAARASSSITFEHRLENVDSALTPEAGISLYRIVQESITNVLKHAQATQVRVELERDIRHLRFVIEDNGQGKVTGSRSGLGGLGLQNIAQRVQLLGGSLQIESLPQRGTRLEMIIPSLDAAE